VDEASLIRAEDKYTRMGFVAALPPDDARRIDAIRALARDYPGSLREAELSSPEACERRRRIARRPVSRTRWAWCVFQPSGDEATSESLAPVPASVLVEGLLGSAEPVETAGLAGAAGPAGAAGFAGSAGPSVREAGAPALDAAAVAVTLWLELHVAIADIVRARARRGGVSMHEFLTSAPADVAARWPVGGTRAVFADLPLRPRTAYLWLAWRAGMDVVSLHRVLFTRVGSWALRADDPAWAHPGAATLVLPPG
jgi:hypothetical protein